MNINKKSIINCFIRNTSGSILRYEMQKSEIKGYKVQGSEIKEKVVLKLPSFCSNQYMLFFIYLLF